MSAVVRQGAVVHLKVKGKSSPIQHAYGALR